MPGNTKRRRRKHRGTQGGSIDRRGRTSRPRSRREALARARGRQVDRRLIPPTWRGATIRGCFFAALLFPIALLFGTPVGGALVLALFAAFFYVPLGYYTDRFFYRRRMARIQRQKLERKAARGADGD